MMWRGRWEGAEGLLKEEAAGVLRTSTARSMVYVRAQDAGLYLLF